jgi:hypothetical protein
MPLSEPPGNDLPSKESSETARKCLARSPPTYVDGPASWACELNDGGHKQKSNRCQSRAEAENQQYRKQNLATSGDEGQMLSREL